MYHKMLLTAKFGPHARRNFESNMFPTWICNEWHFLYSVSVISKKNDVFHFCHSEKRSIFQASRSVGRGWFQFLWMRVGFLLPKGRSTGRSCVTIATMFIFIGSHQHSPGLIRSLGLANNNTPLYPLAFSSANKNIPCPDNILVLPATTFCCISLHSVTYTRLKHLKCQNMPQIFPFW